MTDRKSKRILITGATRGIGKAIALNLAESGYTLCLHCRTRTDLAIEMVDQIKENGGSAHHLQFDVADREDVQKKLADDVEAHDAFYGVVCNAGIAIDKAFPAMTGEDWDAVIHTNLDAFYNVLHPLVMPMIRLRDGGRIVTLSSVSGLQGNRGQTNYSAAKAGIIGATKALAVELAKRKITVNCVAPGVIRTEMTEDVFSEEALKMIPMRRFGEADEVASAVNFLISEGASYVTRQVISVNGGMC